MMPTPEQTIRQWLATTSHDAIPDVVEALLTIEKTAKQSPSDKTISDFLGTWQLCLIAGKQSRASGTRPRQGKALPHWLKIELSYGPDQDSNVDTQPSDAPTQLKHDPLGQITNQVCVGGLRLELHGPWRYYPKSQIMAFDFLNFRLYIFKKLLVSLPIRGGKAAEANFKTQTPREQAFFRYFWVTPTAIAARGRGGGIALWHRIL